MKKDSVVINATITLPENKDLTSVLEKINSDLSKKVGKRVDLDLELIRVISIISKQ
jgi:hypothetical protein